VRGEILAAAAARLALQPNADVYTVIRNYCKQQSISITSREIQTLALEAIRKNAANQFVTTGDDIIDLNSRVSALIPGLKVWYDMSDASTLWQDAGSTPCTADGDEVGRVDDKSGNGYHANQATTTYKPLFKTHYQKRNHTILFDGTDDFMSLPTIDVFSTAITIFAVANSTDNGNEQRVISLQSPDTGSNQCFFITRLYHATDQFGAFCYDSASQEDFLSVDPAGIHVWGLSAQEGSSVYAYDGTTKVATVSGWATAPDATTTYLVQDPDARPQYAGATRFTSAVDISAGEYDTISLNYTGDVSGGSGILTATIPPGTYNSASLLAAAVEAALLPIIGALAAPFDGLAVEVEADADAQLRLILTKAYGDAAGFLEVITDGTPAQDFAILAGWDSDPAPASDQVKIVDGAVARRFTIAGDNTSALLWDRIILRNRLVPGSGSLDMQSSLDQAQLKVEGSSGADLTGLTVNEQGLAGWKATVQPATLRGIVGFADGQVPAATYADARDGQPVVTFYADGGTTPQNNVFKFTFDGTPVTVEFTDAAGAALADGSSADVPLGPATTANTILNQIAVEMANQGLAASAAAAVAAGLVRQEGAAIRFRSGQDDETSAIFIGEGNANDTLGFSDGAQAARTPVETEVLVSALMGHSDATVPASLMTSWITGPALTYFAGEALAKTVRDEANAEYLYIQSLGNVALGVSSSVAWDDATADDVLLPGVGLNAASGDGATGEAGISGFYVTSSDPVDGSGTANDSLLNSGTGQDGTVGQTYRDLVTGLTFTVLEREGGTNYPNGSSFTLNVRRVVTTDSNLPVNTLPGVELLVTNTLGVGAGDTAIVETYERGGNEPAVGDLYYASYNYTKQDFSTKLFTKFASIEAEYGTNSPDHPVTLASYLAILNGAVLVGVKQVQKDIDEDNDGVNDTASVDAFIEALDNLEGPLSGGLLPDILVPLDVPTASVVDYFNLMARHCDVQSTIRHRAERTSIGGMPAGTLPRTAGDTAQAIGRSRFRLVYPDIVTLSLTDAVGTEEEFLVDGSYLAAGLAGTIVQPSVDVATPWTGRKLFGYTGLARTLDAVEQNQTAVRGVTIIEDAPPVLKIRQGLTTQMDNILTKLPTVIQIADEVQQQARATLDRFIGIKFLPGILSQIEGQLSTTLGLLVKAEILTAFTGVKANVASDDPTVAEVEAFYQPVFPLLYIVVTFNLRSTL